MKVKVGTMSVSWVVLMFLLASIAYGQRVTEYYCMPEDIQVRFLGAAAPDGDWHAANVVEPITYSTEAVGVHIDKARLGTLTFEFALQDGMEVHEKAVVMVNVSAIPDGMFRTMELRVRVRADASSGDTVIGPWSDTCTLKLIGKPGQAANR